MRLTQCFSLALPTWPRCLAAGLQYLDGPQPVGLALLLNGRSEKLLFGGTQSRCRRVLAIGTSGG